MAMTVAVVDDDPSMRRGIERVLRAFGYSACVFESAEKFLGVGTAADADCLILDIHLGGLSGLDLRRRLKAGGDTTPVIFVSAADDAATFARAHDAGCVAYLQKPFSAQSLLDAVAKAGEKPESAARASRQPAHVTIR